MYTHWLPSKGTPPSTSHLHALHHTGCCTREAQKATPALHYQHNQLRRTDSTSADTAPASIVSVDDQAKVGAPHCSGYGNRNQGEVCSTLSCPSARPRWVLSRP